MSKITKFVFIFVLSVIGVRNSHGGKSYGKLNLQGRIIATVFTFFDKNGNLDLTSIPKVAQYYYKNNIKVVYISAFYGEGSNLTSDEKEALVLAWEKQCNRLGLDLIVEIGADTFDDMLSFARFCSNRNVTALTAFADVVYQASEPSERVEDLQRICDAANDIPLFHHELTPVNQKVGPVQTYLSACNRVSCFAGVIASSDMFTLLKASTDSLDCQFWVDTSDQTAAGLILRMNAAASPAASLCPGLALDIADAAKAYDVKRALKLQQQMNNIVSSITNFNGGDIDDTAADYIRNLKAAFCIKTGMNMGGRYPMRMPNSTFYDQIRSNLADLNCY